MPIRRALSGVREQRGLARDEVARFASIAPDRLHQFESGEREPSRVQMQKLASIYSVPLYTLYSDSIPNLPALPIDFRKTEPTVASLSPSGVKVLLASERIAQFTAQLAIELNYKPASLAPTVQHLDDPKKHAAVLREFFDDWFQRREGALGFVGTDEQCFLSALRLFFEVQGGIVNINDAPASDYFGFYLRPEAGMPTIFVNRSISSKKAQLFTLVHEYSHALLGAAGISNPFQAQNSIERLCNVFAAEFLAPMETFKATVERLSRTNRTDPSTLISHASSSSLLSKHAAAIRLVETGYLTQKDFRAWRSIFVGKPMAEKEEEKEAVPTAGGGNPHAKRIGELGYLPVMLAKRAVKDHLVDAIDVVDGLGLSTTLQERAFSLAARRFEVALT